MAERMNQGRHRKHERSPWTWPLVVLVALLVVVAVGTVVAVIFG